MLRRSGIVFALCVLSAVSSFAQSSPSPSPSAPQTPLRGFVPPYEILRTVRAAGFEPLAPPLREGTTYVVRAIDFRGVAMRVVVDARSGAIRDANRIVAGPGLYGPYMPGPYAPVYYGRLAAPPTYPLPDDIEPGYGRPPYVGTSELSSGDRHSSGLNLVPLPRPRPASLAATIANEKKPVARPDVATTTPAAAQSEPSRRPAKDAAVPAIND
ncbi:MAG TPA: hypothetical protein VFN27_03885 [Xanthobacteraceae bacterium]|nr:hypothetical protein [Xanthobacteraceae bacterium]